jgi:hypothetical protein
MPNNPQTNLNGLNGLNPLSYLGVNATTPPQVIIKNFNPLPTNNNFAIGTIWINELTSSPFMLVSLARGVANWLALETNAELPWTVAQGGTGNIAFTPYSVITGGITGGSPLESVAVAGAVTGQVLTYQAAGLPTWTTIAGAITLTGNTGGPQTNVGGNFSLLGDDVYVTTDSTPGTVSFVGVGAGFHGDTGLGVQVANAFTINGDGVNVVTHGTANKLTITIQNNPFTAVDIKTDTIEATGVVTAAGLDITTYTTGVLTSGPTGVIASTAILPLAQGGTNNDAYTTNGVVYATGTELATTAASTTFSQVLGNVANVPTWLIPTFQFVNGNIVGDPVEFLELQVTYGGNDYSRLLIVLEDFVISAEDSILLQVYDATADAYVTAGYLSGYNFFSYNATGLTNVPATNGFLLGGNIAAADVINSYVYITGLQSLGAQCVTGTYTSNGANVTFGTVGGGLKLTHPISRLKISTVGTNLFTQGTFALYSN